MRINILRCFISIVEQNLGSQTRRMGGSRKEGLANGMAEAVEGPWIDYLSSMTGVGDLQRSVGSDPLLPEIREGDALRAARAPCQTYFQNLHILGPLSYQLTLWPGTP